MQANNDNPVLNNPYEEPQYYYDTDMNGNIDYATVINGRRPFGYDVNIVPKKRGEKTFFSQEDFISVDPNAEFINSIRKEVKTWREAGYPKASRITKELLDFWFNNKERRANLRLFFCQREAVETAVWLNEIAERDPNTGNYILNLLGERRHTVSTDDAYVLPRTAFKMATGTGKTVVMAMLIIYNYLNKRANPMDTHYADHFLLCAPGITIRDRLSVLQLDYSQRSNNFERTDYYHQRGLIPPQFEKELGGLNASITIVNYQQFLPRVFSGKHASPLDGKQKWVDGELVTQKDKEDYSVMLSRILEKGVKGKRIVVINDEAHHCYLPRQNKDKSLTDDEKSDLKQENEAAMVWYEGLRQMKLLGYKLQQVYDLSATPYYLKGSGYPEYSLFPWVVSDFGLVDAIESGLVKIPFLPAYDNTTDLDEPKLRNIYESIKDKLPKRGIRAQKKKDKEDRSAEGRLQGKNVDTSALAVQAPNLPTLLNTALEQFVKDYEDYDRGLRQAYEAMGTLYTAPPVLIVVCNNTTVSHEVYRDIAGYQDGVNEDGEPRYRKGRFDVFSNYDGMGLPKEKFPTLLIDSSALDEASTRIDEAFKKAYANEIEEFRHEYANQHGAGSADNLTDADILREVVNTVGKPGKLGGDIKCVVSVSMLTEGWDANTVTHVCGIRAFGSQLLCEQVVGRALRRQSYDLIPYDKAGREIDRKDLKRYNPENVTYKFPPEYARIIGVPFNTFKGGQTVVTKPQKPKAIIRALPERQQMEIRFPVITGYRSDNIESLLASSTPLDATQKESLEQLLREFPLPEDANITMKETAMLVIKLLVEQDKANEATKLLKTPTDILRYLWYEKTGYVQIIEPKTLVAHARKLYYHMWGPLDRGVDAAKDMKKKLMLKYDRRACLRVALWLNAIPLTAKQAAENMNPKRGMWVRMIRALRLGEYSRKNGFDHLAEILDVFYKQEYSTWQGRVDKARSENDANKTLALLKERPGLFARCLFASMLRFGSDKVLAAFEEIADNLPARLLLSLGNAAEAYFDPKEVRLARPITGVTHKIEPNKLLALYDDDARKAMVDAVDGLYRDSMARRFAAQGTDAKTIFIDPSLYNIPVSVGDRSTTIQDTSCALMGTRFPVEGDSVRLFLQWGKGLHAQHLDMDLSARIARANGKVSECAYYSLTCVGAKHSGDIRSIPEMVGTAEYIELSLPELDAVDAKYVTFTCNAYSVGALSPNLVVGWMDSANPMKISEKKGVAYDPSCVQHMVRISEGNLSKGLVFGVLDVAKREIIWLEMPFTSQTLRGANSEAIEALLHKLEAKLSIGQLLEMKAKAQNLTIVENAEDADEAYTYEWALNPADVTKLLNQ